MAASIVGHCFDGWSYLSRAAEAELAGDPITAKHLAYYAELRAAMSILAGEGVGVFNARHVVIAASGECIAAETREGTHQFIWPVLEHWAQSSGGTARILDVIRPANIPLKQWTSLFGGTAGFLATDWLRRWGLDLSRLAKDRESRNLASYRPANLVASEPRRVGDVLQTFVDWWEACSPRTVGGFPVIDQHLLRETFVLLFEATTQKSHVRSKKLYATRVSLVLDGLPLSDPNATSLANFLTLVGSRASQPHLVLDASGKRRHTHLQHSQQVIARATLLLRIATGGLATVMRSVGSSVYDDLHFWWSQAAVRRRLWSSTQPPGSFIDLWKDVDDILDDATNWSRTSKPDDSHAEFWNKESASSRVLPTFDRAFFWGCA